MGLEKSDMRSILFAVLLPACGTAPAAPTILVYGDSLSAAYGIPQDAGWWPCWPSGSSRENQIIQWTTRASAAKPRPAGPRASKRCSPGAKPAIVIVELGANDGLRGLPVVRMKSQSGGHRPGGERRGARVILVGMLLPPNYGAQYVDEFRAAFPRRRPRRARRFRAPAFSKASRTDGKCSRRTISIPVRRRSRS